VNALSNDRRNNIEDVAREARVSTATVSRALRGMPNVAPSTRERVRKAARLLEYRADPTASRLASGRTNTVAMVVPILDGWYFATVMAGAEGVLTDRGYELLVFVAGDEEARSRLIMSSRLRGADGMILVDVALTEAEAGTLLQLGGPIVSVGMEFGGFTSVVVDDVEIGRSATQHLVDLGHIDIAILGGAGDDPLGYLVPDRRREGYRQALDKVGIARRAELTIDGTFSVRSGYETMQELLALRHPPTAVFSMSDEMAFGALKAIRDSGLSVPGDISVVGVDDHPMSWVMDLTTVQQKVAGHGALAGRLVLDQIEESHEPLRQEAETSLIIRGSTAPPR